MLRKNNEETYLYKIEINRVENELERKAPEPGFEFDLTGYKTIKGVREWESADLMPDERLQDDLLEDAGHYVLKSASGRIYRIDYEVDLSDERHENIIMVNIILAAVLLLTAGILAFLYFSLIRTFCALSEYPKELSKGHMVPPLPERRSKYFGKFLWGLDVLREKLEEEKKKNLELQKERNVFLLSLSHDIKTPLSAIKLYAASIKKNLYSDGTKTAEIAGKIDDNANEIESYVAKIISASNDDFLDFNVTDGEFYLSEAVDYIKNYYNDKLKALGTEFTVAEFSNLLLRGDKERFIEVMQNILENAVKYGDGRRIGIAFSDEEEFKLVSITNSGEGLSEEEMGHIFDSFYRGSNVGRNS
ncbi:MAG: HAMP domain-containing histidine kinase, partial [Lachnospiraceae bacterium]|nr:HAMP domain-containing histidine kinase [Lachnospiraceae bacterium]